MRNNISASYRSGSGLRRVGELFVTARGRLEGGDEEKRSTGSLDLIDGQRRDQRHIYWGLGVNWVTS